MSNDTNLWERLFKLWAKISMMIMDGKRGLYEVVEHLQKVVDEKDEFWPVAKKFEVEANLGIIEVPANYRHGIRLAQFWDNFGEEFEKLRIYLRLEVNDETFSNPSDILTAGQKLHVRIFKQIALRTTTEEHLRFLNDQGAILPGPQGLSLLYEQKVKDLRRFLPQKHIFCFETTEHAPQTGHYGKSHSRLTVFEEGHSEFTPAQFEAEGVDCSRVPWGRDVFFVVFTKEITE